MCFIFSLSLSLSLAVGFYLLFDFFTVYRFSLFFSLPILSDLLYLMMILHGVFFLVNWHAARQFSNDLQPFDLLLCVHCRPHLCAMVVLPFLLQFDCHFSKIAISIIALFPFAVNDLYREFI